LTIPTVPDMFFAGPERRIAGRVRQFPFWYFRRALFWFGVHNWTELRREKLHSAGMEYDPTQEMIVEICGLRDNNAGFESGQDDCHECREMWRILSRMAIGRTERRLAIAKVIDFYTPPEFRKKEHWVSVEQRGKVIQFYLQVKKPA
jgi:hypothetical protein